MNFAASHRRIERSRFTRHAAMATRTLAARLWRTLADGWLDLQAAHTAHARHRREVGEAVACSALAHRYADTDPGFVADLGHASGRRRARS